MTYYKIIVNSEFVGVGTTYDLRKFQQKHSILITSDENDSQYIQIEDLLYRDSWFATLSTNKYDFINASITSIPKDEYDALKGAMDRQEEIVVDDGTEENQPSDEVYIDPEDEITLDYIKSTKNSEMSCICNRIITNGFDIVLSDKETYHFSLTIQDQLNLITLSSLIGSGEEYIPYHADGELCRYYTAADIQAIVNAATVHKTFHVTYFNSLKSYINALDSIDSISAIEYGCQIPEEYQSDILKQLYEQMAQNNE